MFYVFGFYVIPVILNCSVPVILMSIIIAITLNNKRISHTSWLRKILPILVGAVVCLTGRSILDLSANFQRLLYPFSDLVPHGQIIVVLNSLLVILGGYLAGKISRQNEAVYGLATGVGILIFSFFSIIGIFHMASLLGQNPFWQMGLYVVRTIGLATLGGYFAVFQRKRLTKFYGQY